MFIQNLIFNIINTTKNIVGNQIKLKILLELIWTDLNKEVIN